MMEIERFEKYICGECFKKYNSKEDALLCEKEDRSNKKREHLTEFEIKEEHLKLLKEMSVDWNDCEFGAPEIDPKRPYGNSDGVDDVARIIGFKKSKDTVVFDRDEAKAYGIKDYIEDAEWTKESYEHLNNIHKEMQIVLQIVLSTLSFDKGRYIREDIYTSEWKKVK